MFNVCLVYVVSDPIVIAMYITGMVESERSGETLRALRGLCSSSALLRGGILARARAGRLGISFYTKGFPPLVIVRDFIICILMDFFV